MPSHRITILILSVAVFIIACDDTRGHKKSPKQVLNEQQEQEDSLREAKRAATAHTRYPDAWMLDSLNYRYTYAYQKAIQGRPIVLCNRYVIDDVWLSDSILHVLCLSDRVRLDVACPVKDSTMVSKLVPDLMKSHAESWSLSDLKGWIGPRNRPWLILKMKDVVLVDKNKVNPGDEVYYPWWQNEKLSDFSGTLVDVID